jgi:hypothetical protein
LDHPERCPLCDQGEETMDHLLVDCVFSRQFWFNLLRQVQLQDLTPQPDSNSFLEWWRLGNRVTQSTRKGLNSIIILGAWTISKHRNRCVFDGIAPNLVACLSQADEERKMWELDGAKGISFLMAQLPAT